jgi:hypothetical protein
VKIGAVRTSSSSGSHGLLPLPSTSSEELQSLLHPEWMQEELAERPPEPEPVQAHVLLEQIASHGAEEQGAPETPRIEIERELSEILAEMADEEGSTFQPTAALYQDFSVRCRMRRLAGNCLDLAAFRRRFAMAVAGIADVADEGSADMLRIARGVPDDLLGPFLLLARAAQEGEPCPDDQALARAYGTSSPGRIRRLMEHLEKSGLIVIRSDFGGRRSVGIPALGVTTAPLEA